VLLLVFRFDADRYAVDMRRITEVLPLVTVRAIPGSPPGVSGMFIYRGTPIPVVDLKILMTGAPSDARASTRILVVDLHIDGHRRQLGLIAERATETLRREAADFVPCSVTSESGPQLGPITTDALGIIQMVDPDTILPPATREQLFREAVA
jgi:chemotaxis-related protein WspB